MPARSLSDDDPRIRCDEECANFDASNRSCLAARRGERKDVPRGFYQPVLEPPLMCVFFVPLPGAADRRNGRERWPGLARWYDETYGKGPTMGDRIAQAREAIHGELVA